MNGKKKTHMWPLGVVCAVIFYGTCILTDLIMGRGSDLTVHTNNASLLEFSNPVPFFRRFTYPVYHVLTAFFNRVFRISIYNSGVLVVTIFVLLTVIVTYIILKCFLKEMYSEYIICGLTFVLTYVTAIYLPWYNKEVYIGQSSPNIWHSPTQAVVKAAGLLAMFQYVKFFYDYQEMLKDDSKKTLFPWKKIGLFSLLLLYTVLAKPSFLQGFLPAVCIFLLIELVISKGKIFLFCVQSGLVFLPSCLYLLYQLLFYYSEGSEYSRGGIKFTFFGFIDSSAPNILISSGLLYAFPIFCIIFVARKEIFTDKYLMLIVLFAVVSFCESACMAEALGNSAGNFSWAKQLSVYFLWVITVIKYFQKKASGSEFSGGGTKWIYRIGDILLMAHFISGIYYYVLLFRGPNSL